jgi:predicted acetyltransferase
MRVEIERATEQQRETLANLLELYSYDFTEFADNDAGEDGRFGYGYLPDYFTDPRRHAFLVRVEGRYAGFALVRQLDRDGEVVADMAEFFIMRRYRRHGAGEIVAHQMFDMFPGPWELRVMRMNEPAQAFWRRAVRDYAGNAFSEEWLDGGGWLCISFIAPASPAITDD